MKQPKMKVQGYSMTEMLTDFAEGKRIISQGKMFEKKGECVVSAELAKLNDLKVGSSIELSGTMKNDKPVTLTVTEIYSDYTAENTTPIKGPFMNRRNEFLTSFETASLFTSGVQGAMVNIKYTLKSPEVKADFEKEIRSQGLSPYFVVKASEALYNYEIGVLRAMGMKKVNVIKGLVTETLLVTLVAMVVSVGVGLFISQPVSDSLLASQVQAAEDAVKKASANMGGMTLVDPTVIIEICLIAIFLVLLSGIVSLRFITKFEPIKILSDRN